ncbi:MAG: arginine--tRNA ligase [Zetaproteobacteria bacterium CG_4_9_14_3_um_filter_49_83]|nr:MAG: arginine--tRNA ligase [Zetaproteobacteria bacterium CG17_big_fil_post_rev_8_21_14_2_50_50_13]PIV30066.1 MAG: arginine--tRNA ligase [Zetaproteobacteria bacterium CG02_land_8_20_14_3_00_50_9]PIY56981.1 MAG: arginine--tRNA ligase [Zetaproteobacteria bacterium CG_4_10_14_0_8_um_filter_49_80]PJA34648.1 MAG: arginine--tRNA ligase [Zetaproteobacteria bacterium CG_4_9_14_3_um_filter_49_83]
MKQQLEQALQQSVDMLLGESGISESVEVQLTRTKQKEHGDYAANVAMPLAKTLKMAPHAIAVKILATVQWPEAVEGADIAGPGFINIRLRKAAEAKILKAIVQAGSAYGMAEPKHIKVNVEFVSANPTGPMHVGHGRGAVIGDALSRVLQASGFDVTREYYINDAGNQIGVLAESVWLRMRELQGEKVTIPERCYPGDYIIEIARDLLQEGDDVELLAMSDEARLQWVGSRAVAANMQMIRNDLAQLGIAFDVFFSEKQLHDSGRVQSLIEKLKTDGLVYFGTLPPPKGKEIEDYQAASQWLFRTTQFGDDVDRPLAKQDGTATYFAADIAYHEDKALRKFERMIDVWGADHGGYVTRVQSAVKALTGKDQQPEVVLVQMVNLTRNGQPVRMSKRAGTFVTLEEVVSEVGADAVRFNFLTRRAESQLDFDLETAKQKNDENPVYYVQYAHARISNMIDKAAAEGLTLGEVDAVDLSHLTSDKESELTAKLMAYPETIEKAAERCEPYRVAIYLMELAAVFHRFYHDHRVIGDDVALSKARLMLVTATRQVLANGLQLLGVSTPERM